MTGAAIGGFMSVLVNSPGIASVSLGIALGTIAFIGQKGYEKYGLNLSIDEFKKDNK